MSVLSSFFTTSYTNQRVTNTDSTSGSTLSTIATSNCVIEQITDRSKLTDEANWGKEYRMFCSSTEDIEEGDIIDVGGTKYTVRSVNVYNDLVGGRETHTEAVLIKK